MEESLQVFYLTIASMGCALIIACMKSMYKSKCENVDICCIHIKRNIDLESQIDKENPVGEIELEESGKN
jgi:hypothetical protein